MPGIVEQHAGCVRSIGCYSVGMATRRASRSTSNDERSLPATEAGRSVTKSGPTRLLLDRLRAICLALPEANERLSHGEPTWFAGKGKVFAMFDDHHHGAAHVAVWLPLPPGAQEDLVASDPARFFRPPYVGSSGWVGVVLSSSPDWPLVTALVRDAFVHVATKKLVAQLPGTTR